MTTFRKRRPCWHCGKANDMLAHAFGDGLEPKAGDIGMCIGCGAFAIVTHELGLREPTIAESEEILADREAMRARDAWRSMNARRLSS